MTFGITKISTPLSFPQKRAPRTIWSGITLTQTVSVGFLFLLLVVNSFSLDNSERLFIWNEANAAMQNAKTPPDYLHTAAIYQRLVDDGVRNGPLFYNIGTALLLAERYELAVDAFERAERYFGHQVDNEQNLKIALAKKTKSRTAVLPWYRLAAFWHFYLSCPQRTSIASGAFLLFWLALVLKYVSSSQRSIWRNPGRFTVKLLKGIKRLTNAIAMFSLVIFIVFASSAAASWQAESSARRYHLDMQPLLPPTNAPPTL